MKITYNKNPLFTTVELDENEKKEFWYKIKIEQLTERLEEAEFSLTDPEHFNLDEAKKYLNSDYYNPDSGEKSKLDTHCDMLFHTYLKELQLSHYGDCTCFSSSCLKCLAERILGIDTTKGLKPHCANKIFLAFGGNENNKTIDEAIEELSTLKINPIDYQTESWKKLGGHEQYIPRWTEETKQAHDWLINYKKQYLKH